MATFNRGCRICSKLRATSATFRASSSSRSRSPTIVDHCRLTSQVSRPNLQSSSCAWHGSFHRSLRSQRVHPRAYRGDCTLKGSSVCHHVLTSSTARSKCQLLGRFSSSVVTQPHFDPSELTDDTSSRGDNQQDETVAAENMLKVLTPAFRSRRSKRK